MIFEEGPEETIALTQIVHDILDKIQNKYEFGIRFNKLMDLNSNLAESFFPLTPVVLTIPPKVPDWHGLVQLLSA